ncbi:hypothetical protein [Mycobacterium canetti]|uniref:hypothetical protein n=1 Tax=Mycobacterium canetti TaxID=78331 RepID=UPI00138B1A2F|nr:hypothetical protein [Mycobacterium canetti]
MPPSNPIDVRAPAATVSGGRVRLRHRAAEVDYADTGKSARVSAADMSTRSIFQRPAALFRYLISAGEPYADTQAIARINTLVDDNLMLAQRLAQQEVLAKAVDLDDNRRGRQQAPKIIGYRRVIHPELSLGGTCGMCIAASDRVYRVGELMPLHNLCRCTVAAVTEEHDPADDLNAVDLRQLYKDAGGNTVAHLKRTRYQVDEHGELGPVLVPKKAYKPRSAAPKRIARNQQSSSTSDQESKAQIAARLLPGLEKNLQDLRSKGISEDSPQITYHKNTIERLRRDLKTAGIAQEASKKAAKRKQEPRPKLSTGDSGGDDGGRRPPGGRGGGPTDDGGDQDDNPDLTPQQRAEARLAAQGQRARAEGAEPDVTQAVRAATTAQGGELQRLDSRLKEEGSLYRKIQELMADGDQADQAAVMVRDSLRYTAVVPEQNYWARGTAIGDALVAAGFIRDKQVQGWENEGYKGRNDTFLTPEGLQFEVQIHTVESLKAAETAHPLYKEQRLPTTSAVRKRQLDAQQKAIFAAVPIPNDVPQLD